MQQRQSISTPNAPAAIGPYSQAIVAGGLAHCSGQVGMDPATGELVGPGVVEQARQCMANLSAVLEAAGTSLHRAVRCTIFLADLEDFAAVNAVYAEAFEGCEPPSRACVAILEAIASDMTTEIATGSVASRPRRVPSRRRWKRDSLLFPTARIPAVEISDSGGLELTTNRRSKRNVE